MDERVVIQHEQFPWSCEDCGGGAHERVTVTIGETVHTYSYNDHLGGPLNKETDQEVFGTDEGEGFAVGVFYGMKLAGLKNLTLIARQQPTV